MTKLSQLKIPALILLLITLVTVGFVSQLWPDNYYHIVGCDVGQGDAFLFTSGFQQLLIDTGPNDKVMECLAQYIPFWDRTIEVVMITHADKDHVGGLQYVLSGYTVNLLLMNPTQKQTQIIHQLEEKIQQLGINRQPLFQSQIVSLHNAKKDIVFTTLWPEENVFLNCQKFNEKCETKHNPKHSSFRIDYSDENELSISGVVALDGVKIMMTGDIGISVEQAMVGDGLLVDVDMLKASHHGSKNSSSSIFVDVLSPETTMIGVGKNNRYGHPSTRVIDLFRSININILSTAEMGTFEIVSDGQIYWLKK